MDPQGSLSPTLKCWSHTGIKPVTLTLLAPCSDQVSRSSWIKRKPKSHTKLWARQTQEGTLTWRGCAVGHDAWKHPSPWEEAVPQQPSWAMLTLRCLSSPRAGPSRAGSSGTVVPWQARCPWAMPQCSLPRRGDPMSPLYAPCSDSIVHLSSFTDVMTGNMLKLGACSQQRDSGRHPSSWCCRHETTAPCTTA